MGIFCGWILVNFHCWVCYSSIVTSNMIRLLSENSEVMINIPWSSIKMYQSLVVFFKIWYFDSYCGFWLISLSNWLWQTQGQVSYILERNGNHHIELPGEPYRLDVLNGTWGYFDSNRPWEILNLQAAFRQKNHSFSKHQVTSQVSVLDRSGVGNSIDTKQATIDSHHQPLSKYTSSQLSECRNHILNLVNFMMFWMRTENWINTHWKTCWRMPVQTVNPKQTFVAVSLIAYSMSWFATAG